MYALKCLQVRQGEDGDWKVVDFNGAVIPDDLSGLLSFVSDDPRARANRVGGARGQEN